MSESQPLPRQGSSDRFTISYRNYGGYRVSIPGYDGGEVVRAEVYDRLLGMLEGIIEAADHSDAGLYNAVKHAQAALEGPNVPQPSHSGRDDLMASLDRADQDLAAGHARLLDDGLIASLPEDSTMTVITRREVELEAEVERLREQWRLGDAALQRQFDAMRAERDEARQQLEGAVGALRETRHALSHNDPPRAAVDAARAIVDAALGALGGQYQDPEIEAPIKFVPGVKAHGRGR